MNYLKKLALAGAVIAVLAVFLAPTAPATQLTGAGGGVLGVGTVIKGSAEGTIELHPAIGSLNCKKASLGGEVTKAGSSGETVFVQVNEHVFIDCNGAFVVLTRGIWEMHTANTNNAITTSSGTQLTVTYLGFHCIFTTNNTQMGTLTGSATTGGSATLDIAATIPRTGGSSGAFCGSTAQMTGSYSFSQPGTLNVH